MPLPEIIPCPPSRRQEAIALALRDSADPGNQDREIQWLAQAEAEPHVAGGLLAAFDGDRLLGAILATLQPGRLVGLAPRAAAEAPAGLTQALIAAGIEHAQAAGACIAQALTRDDPALEAAFSESGFRSARLLLLACDAPATPTPAGGDLRFDPAPEERALAEVVEATYIDTLDCPWMNGWRLVEDVLATSRASGQYDPMRWFLIRRDAPEGARKGAEAVGCLLLTDHPAADALELVYMGVVPRRRGERLSAALIRQALDQARQARRSRVLLFVDEANLPARRAYENAGFLAIDRRTCHVRRL